MSIRKQWLIGLIGMILLLLVFVVVYFYTQATTTAKMANMVSRLSELRKSIFLYQQNHHKFPDTLDDLDIGAETKKDPLTGRSFTYMRPEENILAMPMVVQPAPFRTKLWPFGEIRQYCLFTDGEIKGNKGQFSTNNKSICYTNSADFKFRKDK